MLPSKTCLVRGTSAGSLFLCKYSIETQLDASLPPNAPKKSSVLVLWDTAIEKKKLCQARWRQRAGQYWFKGMDLWFGVDEGPFELY